RALQQIAVGPRRERPGDQLVRAVRREHDDARAGLGRDPLGGPDAVPLGHADVDEGDIRTLRRAEGDGVEAVVRLADDLDAGIGRQDRGDPAADRLVVVDDDDTHRPAHDAAPVVGTESVARHRVPESVAPDSSRTPDPSSSSAAPAIPMPLPRRGSTPDATSFVTATLSPFALSTSTSTVPRPCLTALASSSRSTRRITRTRASGWRASAV